MKHKERKAELAAEAASQTDALLAWCIDCARDVVDNTPSIVSTSTPLKAGERALLELDGVQLLEPRRAGARWQGGTQRVSVHIPGTRSARYRVGSTRRHFVRVAEQLTVIDAGLLTITTTRAVFVGSKESREWLWAKLTGIYDEPGVARTSIGVSNRQQVSGVAYPPARAVEVRFYLELGAAAGNGTAKDLLAELEQERASSKAKPE